MLFIYVNERYYMLHSDKNSDTFIDNYCNIVIINNVSLSLFILLKSEYSNHYKQHHNLVSSADIFWSIIFFLPTQAVVLSENAALQYISFSHINGWIWSQHNEANNSSYNFFRSMKIKWNSLQKLWHEDKVRKLGVIRGIKHPKPRFDVLILNGLQTAETHGI